MSIPTPAVETAADDLGPIIDSHAHLDEPVFDRDRAAVVAAAAAAGVVAVVNIGYRPARWETTRRLCDDQPLVAAALGLHPAHADEWSPTVERHLRMALAATPAVAIGEIGLDFFRPGPTPAQQERALAAQLDLAIELDLPVVVHQRAAEAELVAALGDRPLPSRLVFHSFEGTARLAAFAVERGIALGLGGLALKPSAAELRRVLASIPTEQILLETDSPYLPPPGVKDRRNQPANLPAIARHAAGIWSTAPRDLVARTTANARAFFGLETVRG